MKLEINTNNLIGIVERVVRSTGKNLTLPVLSCLFMKVDENSGFFEIKSTNLDIGSEFSVKANCLKNGSIAVPANIFLNLLSSLKNNQNIKMSSVEGNLLVESKNNSSIIKCLPVEDFPLIPKIKEGSSVLIKANDFIFGIKSVWYSSSISNIKPELSSVFVYPEDQNLIFTATDSFRLAEKKIFYKKTADFQAIIVPYKNLVDIVKILEGFEEEISICFDKNQISFNFNSGKVVSRIIEGSFPDYKQIIPKEHKTEVIILKNDLINAVKSAQIFSDNLNQIKFSITNSSKFLEIMVKNNDIGEYKESIAAKISGDDLDISFNHKYILDSMQSINSDSLILSFSGIGRPMMIKGVGDNSFLYIVMPMNR